MRDMVQRLYPMWDKVKSPYQTIVGNFYLRNLITESWMKNNKNIREY